MAPQKKENMLNIYRSVVILLLSFVSFFLINFYNDVKDWMKVTNDLTKQQIIFQNELDRLNDKINAVHVSAWNERNKTK